jgi:hypothetical protein
MRHRVKWCASSVCMQHRVIGSASSAVKDYGPKRRRMMGQTFAGPVACGERLGAISGQLRRFA